MESTSQRTSGEETVTMSGVGKFKLTDALPKNMPGEVGSVPSGAGHQSGSRGKAKSKKATVGKAKSGQQQSAEQLREARESTKAKNAEASVRGHMVDIGRGNQQAGRQKAK
jgi:hypothetical protein